MPAWAALCETHGVTIFGSAILDTFVYADTPLAKVAGKLESKADPELFHRAVSGAFAISDERWFEQDTRFGLAVMSEIANRALSRAVNDPGTAIDVICRSTRLLSLWARGPDTSEDPLHPHLHVPPLETGDLFEDTFMALARDGAAMIEVQLRVQKAFLELSRLGNDALRATALRQSRMAAGCALAAFELGMDKARLLELLEATPKYLSIAVVGRQWRIQYCQQKHCVVDPKPLGRTVLCKPAVSRRRSQAQFED
jgi:uncharacterized membrane protein